MIYSTLPERLLTLRVKRLVAAIGAAIVAAVAVHAAARRGNLLSDFFGARGVEAAGTVHIDDIRRVEFEIAGAQRLFGERHVFDMAIVTLA